MKKIYFTSLLFFLVSISSCDKDLVIHTLNVNVVPENSGKTNISSIELLDGEMVTISAEGYEEYNFSNWSGGLNSNLKEIELRIKSDLNITANFEKKKFSVDVSIEGEGKVNQEIIKSGSYDNYIINSIVKLTAVPEKNYRFSHWEGDIVSNDNPLQVTINKNYKISAIFVKKVFNIEFEIDLINNFKTHTFSNIPTIEDLKITVIKAGNANEYNSGTIISLEAKDIPEIVSKRTVNNEILYDNQQPPWIFKRWEGSIESIENPIQITIDDTKKIKAVYETANPVYLDNNNLTVKSFDWSKNGYQGIINNKTYTVVDVKHLKEMIKNKDDISLAVTTNIKSFNSLFGDAYKIDSDGDGKFSSLNDSLNRINLLSNFNVDISSWDVSNSESFNSLFKDCISFNQDISHWNMKNAKSTSSMFKNAKSFNQNLENWEVQNVTKMFKMFDGAENFNGDISEWNMSNVTDISGMFKNASNFNIDISSWNIDNVINNSSFLYGASSFNQDLSIWCFSKSCDSSHSFSYKSALQNSFLPNWGGCFVKNKNEYTLCISEKSSKSNIDYNYNLSGYENSSKFITESPINYKLGDRIIVNSLSKKIDFYFEGNSIKSSDTITKKFENRVTNKAIHFTPSTKGNVYIKQKNGTIITKLIIN